MSVGQRRLRLQRIDHAQQLLDARQAPSRPAADELVQAAIDAGAPGDDRRVGCPLPDEAGLEIENSLPTQHAAEPARVATVGAAVVGSDTRIRCHVGRISSRVFIVGCGEIVGSSVPASTIQ
jgi:hypothetical protein